MKKCHFDLEKDCVTQHKGMIPNICIACQMHERNKIERHGDELQERLIKTQEALTKAVTPDVYQGSETSPAGGTGYK